MVSLKPYYILVIALLLFLSLSAAKTDKIHEHDRKAMNYWLSAMRGLWSGYQKEFYHNQKTFDEKCFSVDSRDDILQILSFLVYGSFNELLATSDAVFDLFNNNLNHCGVKETFSAIQDKCSESAEACSMYTIYQNVSGKVFKVMQIVNSMIDLALNWSVKDENTVFNTMYEVGIEAGSIITVVFNV